LLRNLQADNLETDGMPYYPDRGEIVSSVMSRVAWDTKNSHKTIQVSVFAVATGLQVTLITLGCSPIFEPDNYPQVESKC
jgi:hypothetical protein